LAGHRAGCRGAEEWAYRLPKSGDACPGAAEWACPMLRWADERERRDGQRVRRREVLP
jgi:hypothetical protein